MTDTSPDSPPSSTPDHEALALTIVAAPRYLVGLPILVAVTLDNRTQETEFYRLPRLDPTVSRSPIAARWQPLEGGPALDTRFAEVDEEAPTELVALAPGESAQMLVDLSNMGYALPLGHYALSLSLRVGADARDSNVVELELAGLSAADASEAKRLRSLAPGPTEGGAWAPFLTNNWNTVTCTLSPAAAEQVALHLFLHRATHGPEPLAAVDPSPLAGIRAPHLAAEVAALEHELALARGDARAAAMRASMLASFPGLALRADENERGEGFLALMRTSVGAERQHLRPPATMPYVP